MLYNNVIVGSYINFAICEYYNDDVFTQLSTLVLQMVGCLDVAKLKQYSKVELQVYKMLWSFFSSHMELLFMKFDASLINSITSVLTSGLQGSPAFEVQSDVSNCITVVCEFVHEKLQRPPSLKTAFLQQCVNKYFTE